MASKKFYVVWAGRKPGIYTSWPDCLKQVHKFQGARYKGYESREEAEAAFADSRPSGGRPGGGGATGRSAGRGRAGGVREERPDPSALSVDGACSGNPGPMEYRAVWVGTKEEAFRGGPMQGTNNLGEFLGLVQALRMLAEAGDSTTPIYTDSLTARAWVRDRKVKSTLPRTAATAEVWEQVDRALGWLRTHAARSPIKVWDTRRWGEIPADFGRK